VAQEIQDQVEQLDLEEWADDQEIQEVPVTEDLMGVLDLRVLLVEQDDLDHLDLADYQEVVALLELWDLLEVVVVELLDREVLLDQQDFQGVQDLKGL